MKKRAFAKTRGGTERTPNLVATAADDHNIAKRIPIKMFFMSSIGVIDMAQYLHCSKL